MIVPNAPLAVLPNVSYGIISPVHPSTGQGWQCEIQNYSGLVLTLTWYNGTKVVAPYTADIIKDDAGEVPPTITFITAPRPTGNVTPGASQQYVVASFAQFPDCFTDQYPHALSVLPASSNTLVGSFAYDTIALGRVFSVPGPNTAGAGPSGGGGGVTQTYFDVSDYKSILLQIANGGQSADDHMQLQLSWSINLPGGILTLNVGQYYQYIYSTSGKVLNILIPVIMPFLQVSAIVGGAATHGVGNITIIGSNTETLAAHSINALPMAFSPGAIVAGGNSGLLLPPYDCIGPVMLNFDSGGVGQLFYVEVQDFDQNDTNISIPYTASPPGSRTYQMALFLSTWRHKFIFFNLSAAAVTPNFSVTPMA